MAGRQPARLSREEKKQATRNRLIEAAAEVISRKGFAATSVDEVAEHAGLTKGAVYSNFASKEELFLAVIDRHVSQRTETIADVVEAGRPLGEQLAQGGQIFTAALAEDRKWFLLGLEFSIYAARNPDVTPTLGRGYRQMRTQVAELIQRRADEQGRALPVAADQLARAIFALSHGLALEKLGDPDGVSDRLFGEILGLVLQSLTADDAAC
jgi:AcrR family transcriptional regulator